MDLCLNNQFAVFSSSVLMIQYEEQALSNLEELQKAMINEDSYKKHNITNMKDKPFLFSCCDVSTTSLSAGHSRY